jgi:preprotein translocase subunit SecE
MFKRLWETIVDFLSDVRSELKKVSYPTKNETLGSTTVVLIFCVIMSMYLSFVDSLLVWIISKVL